VAAENGEDAMQKVQETEFDLILTDVRMPKFNGTHLLQEVKQINPQFPKIFVISGFMDHSLDELLHWGADGFFSKPFDSTAVRKALTEALLDPRQRWAQRPKEPPSLTVHKHYKNIVEAKSKREFAPWALWFLHSGERS
jgi:YesN/AraC family two-component response regulator